jgi:DNA-binding transcriptional LysR family regulator
MLDPNQLRTLRAVIAHGSFAAAAAELQYTPSAVSQQIAALERSTGIVLFERGPRFVAPTPAATRLAERAGELLTGLDDLERDVAALARGEAGVLRIGCFPTAGARILPTALAELTRRRPGVELRLDEGELDSLLPAVAAGELDLALAYRYDLVPTSWAPSLVEHRLLDDPLQVLLPRRHPATADSVRLNALRDERWVAALAGSPGAVNLERLCAAARFTPNVAFRSNDYAVVQGLVAAGLGVALVPGLAVNARGFALAGRSARRHVVALHRRGNANPLLAPALAALDRAVSTRGPVSARRPGPQ